ncbi:hypothetical protein Dimus_010138 [Dionaea muscipula]
MVKNWDIYIYVRCWHIHLKSSLKLHHTMILQILFLSQISRNSNKTISTQQTNEFSSLIKTKKKSMNNSNLLNSTHKKHNGKKLAYTSQIPIFMQNITLYLIPMSTPNSQAIRYFLPQNNFKYLNSTIPSQINSKPNQFQNNSKPNT